MFTDARTFIPRVAALILASLLAVSMAGVTSAAADSPPPDDPAVTVMILGQAIVGSTLDVAFASPKGWEDVVRTTQWGYLDDDETFVPIEGETDLSLIVKEDWMGRFIVVEMTFTSGEKSVTGRSGPYGPVAAPRPFKMVITGEAVVAETLTADVTPADGWEDWGLWENDAHYVWYRIERKDDGTVSAVVGSGAEFTATDEEVGFCVYVELSVPSPPLDETLVLRSEPYGPVSAANGDEGDAEDCHEAGDGDASESGDIPENGNRVINGDDENGEDEGDGDVDDGDEGVSVEFVDVADDNAHGEAIYRLVDYGVTKGLSPTVFNPTGSVIRDQMASFLVRVLALTGEDTGDVDNHADALDLLRDRGLYVGDADGNLLASRTLTRGQAASVLVRLIERVTGEELRHDGVTFPDVAVGSAHEVNIAKLVESGIIKGYTDGRFGPGDDLRREQMASILVRTIDLLIAGGHIEG